MNGKQEYQVKELQETFISTPASQELAEEMKVWLDVLPAQTHRRVREEWVLMVTEKLRQYIEVDIMNPERKSMPPQLVETYIRIMKQLGEVEDRSYQRLEMLREDGNKDKDHLEYRTKTLAKARKQDPESL